MKLSKILALLVSLSLFYGCEEKHFSKCYDTSIKGKTLTQLRISAHDPTLRRMVKELLRQDGIVINDRADLTLEVEVTKYARHCNNPLTCSYDASYDGYVKITLLRRMQPLYMTQQDYHGDFESAKLARLIERMYDELDLKIK